MTVQVEAQMQFLAFLGTVALVGIGGLATVALAIAGRRRFAAAAASGALVVLGGYAAVLVALGALGQDQVLGPGEAKVFCEVDCHLAYSVSRVRVAPIAPGDTAGHRYEVTVRTHFDARTVPSWRGDAPLTPNARRVRVVDGRHRVWTPVTRGGTPLSTPLRPGASYETTFGFDLPADVATPRLELTEAAAITRLILGHENSPMHGKTLLALGRGFAASRKKSD